MLDLMASLRASAVLSVNTPHGRVQYRCAGHASHVTHVLLHGIGSGSASWVTQLACAQDRHDVRVLAWEAPGYGESTPLPMPVPLAADYAQQMWAWLDALQQQGEDAFSPFVLVGHSLGALMAASAAKMRPQSVAQLVLLSPAQGYGDASTQERDDKLNTRLQNLQQWGPEGMAQRRSQAMLSASATTQQLQWVRDIMAQVQPQGYAQAAHMLAKGTLLRDVVNLPCAVTVASGQADTITPPDACALVAREAGVSWVSLGPVGHACALEASDSVNVLLGLSNTDVERVSDE